MLDISKLQDAAGTLIIRDSRKKDASGIIIIIIRFASCSIIALHESAMRTFAVQSQIGCFESGLH
jgi:hypothetical protein